VTGAIVLGADYRGLGVVQSLGRRGVPVWVVYDALRGVANFSRYTTRSVREPGDRGSRIGFLLGLVADHGLRGWALFPTGDETTAFCARNRDTLAEVLRPTTPSWDVVRWAHDKRSTHGLALDAGVRSPRLWQRPEEHALAEGPFPVVVKPAVRVEANPLTRDKAWRADDADELERLYGRACALMPPEDVMIQELVPGDGGRQLSYAAFAVDGEPVATLVARRTRQYPMDFGRASTFVESIDDERVAAAGARLLAAMSYTGIVEMEFKEHASTGEVMLLDVNPRVWGWHTLGFRAGVDFPWLAWELANGRRAPQARGRAGVRWIWPAADLPVAMRELLAGRLRFREYLDGFRRPVDLATLARDDPLPGLVEVPLHLAARVRGRLGRAAHPGGRPVGTLGRAA
jgi:predicted ATP-grasp superfamily ATP-dependent carboligase